MTVIGNWRVFKATVWQPLYAHAGRTLLAVIAIALGVALGLAIFLMTHAATAEMTRAARSLFGQADWIVQGTSEGFDESLYPVIARIPGVAIASPIVEVRARVVGHRESLVILGRDFLQASRLQPTLPTARRSRESLSFFDPQFIQLNAIAAANLHANIGDTITLQVGMQPVTFKVAGILPGGMYRQDVGLLDIAAAQWQLDKLGKLTRIEVYLKPNANTADVIAAIERVLPANVKLTTPAIESQQAEQLVRPFTINLLGVALVALFTGAFLVYSTQSLTIIRRRREFALLHAIGLTAQEQIASVILTGTLLGVIGALLGAALGIAIANVGLPVFLSGTNGAALSQQVQLAPLQLIVFASLGMLASVAGSVAPALAAARIPTAQALKSGNINQRSTRSHAYTALMLWALAIPLLFAPPLFDLPLFGYTAIASILFGAVLLMPAFTRFVFSLLPQRPQISYRTAVAQLRGVAHTATTSVATMLVSVSLMVAMSILGASLRNSIAQWAERMFPADIYVQAGSDGISYLDKSTIDALASAQYIEHAESSRVIPILLAKDHPPVSFIARSITSLPLDAKAQRAIPPGAVPIWINVALADREQLSPDSTVHFQIADRDITGSVRGVWRDFQHPNGALAMDYDQYRQLTGDDRVNSLSLWLKPSSSVETILPLVRQRIGEGIEMDIVLPGEYRARLLRGFDSLFAIMYVLLAISVLIGLFGIGVNASAQVLARRAEFGVLRHLGFTRRQIGTVLGIEGLFLGTLGIFAGLLTGTAISVIMIYVVSRQSFHSIVDLHVPFNVLMTLAITVPIASALTAVWSGRIAMNDDVVRAVKEDW